MVWTCQQQGNESKNGETKAKRVKQKQPLAKQKQNLME
jgi:hypothetical protein